MDEDRDPAALDESGRTAEERRERRGRSQKAFGMVLVAVGMLSTVLTLILVVSMLLPFAVLTLVCALTAFGGARLVRAGESNAPSPDAALTESNHNPKRRRTST